MFIINSTRSMNQLSKNLLMIISSNNNNSLNKIYLPSCTACRNINLKPKLKDFINCDYVDSMDYGIYALTTGYIKEAAMEAARIAVVRKAKTRQVWKIPSETPFTKKPLGTRMGKGKGKLDYWAASAVAGQVILEFGCENDTLARDAFKQVKAKLPVRVHLRIKPKEEKIMLTGYELLDMVKEDQERKLRLGLE